MSTDLPSSNNDSYGTLPIVAETPKKESKTPDIIKNMPGFIKNVMPRVFKMEDIDPVDEIFTFATRSKDAVLKDSFDR